MRPEKCPHKSPDGMQKPLGISARSDYVPVRTSVQDPRMLRVIARALGARAAPIERFQDAGSVEREARIKSRLRCSDLKRTKA